MILDQLFDRYALGRQHGFVQEPGNPFAPAFSGRGTLSVALNVFFTVMPEMAGTGTLSVALTVGRAGKPEAEVTSFPNPVVRAYIGHIPVAYFSRIVRYTAITDVPVSATEQQFDPSIQGDPGIDVELP